MLLWMLWYVHACVGCSTHNKPFQVLFLCFADWVKRALKCHFWVWTRRGSGWLRYRRCTYYDDCAITSVFFFWKSENLEKQICNKVYIFLLHFAVLCFAFLHLSDLELGDTIVCWRGSILSIWVIVWVSFTSCPSNPCPLRRSGDSQKLRLTDMVLHVQLQFSICVCVCVFLFSFVFLWVWGGGGGGGGLLP